MDLEWLEAFLVAARTGSFSAASRQLSLSQSALSRQIQALERQLGVSLFDRGPNGAQLSPAGERFLDFAEAILSLFRHASQAVSPAWAQGRTLRVVAGSTPGVYLLPCVLAEFSKRRPDVRLVMEVANSAAAEEAVAAAKADLGVIDCSPSDERLAAVPYMQDRLVLVTGVTGGNGQKRPELLLLREKGSCIRRVVENLLRWAPNQDMLATLEIGSTEAIKHAVACGMGSAYLPEVAVRKEVRAGALRLVHWPGMTGVAAAGTDDHATGVAGHAAGTGDCCGLNRDLWFVFPKGGVPERDLLELMAIAVRRARSWQRQAARSG